MKGEETDKALSACIAARAGFEVQVGVKVEVIASSKMLVTRGHDVKRHRLLLLVHSRHIAAITIL